MLFTKLLLLCLSCKTSWAFFVERANRNVGSRTFSTSSLRPLGVATFSANSNIGDKPTIAIVGSGAVGSYYGSRLWETGWYDVKFYMRGEHYLTSVEEGLTVTSVDGDIFIPPESLLAYNETSKIGPVDWVIVSLKSTALNAIPALVAPLLDPSRTRVLVIMNGLIEEDLIRELKSQVGEEQNVGGDSILRCCAALYGGMALVCCNRLGPGQVNHSYAGLLSGGVAASNPGTTTEQENKDAFNQLWEPTKITTKYEPCLLAGRWRKVRKTSIRDSVSGEG
jgi:2-dehydropantoate 2-reductase